MSIASNGKKLDLITGELMRTWEKTRPAWGDAKCQAFQETYIEPISTSVTAAVKACNQLDELIRKIRNDCE